MPPEIFDFGVNKNTRYQFPDHNKATPDGLLAVGGDLSRECLLAAYSNGIFPWYSEGQPILWWCPDPRPVFFPGKLKISRSLRKTLKQSHFIITIDKCFEEVIKECAKPRRNQKETWITQDMHDAYCDLHNIGYAHSVEVWGGDLLVGGLYGVALGRVFFGESMFFKETNASKIALIGLDWLLQKLNFSLIDCQIVSPHVMSLGAENISRSDFISQIKKSIAVSSFTDYWTLNVMAKDLLCTTKEN
ncbi:MAG: leucyl/phenylalanyl-tRNA--protein transferase [Acidiferrobacteraceae bacterium]|nr:leucyl/phenylalanyl-tRNA--protein transferase [Acidiferrobacteraceae bacterium]|tara:strand:- start:7194 stop:7931 length:738 start_codon:yes stop_codon:yes gene_type:complete